ncbi:MAG: biopolymer transporter ExbD [Holosporales bacterium]|jgi:biopolymer transport protein TolR|nr:biopolymer transporter ExbD [Holosporales bacterium]
MNVRNGSRRQKVQVYINIAPLVEVMLVVIIIFMITAPMLNVGVQVDLPQTKAASLAETKNAPVIVSIDKDSQIYIEEANVTLDELIQKLPMILENGKSDTVYIRGDKDLQYGVIMKIMGFISSAGACKVSLISEVDSTNHISSLNSSLKDKSNGFSGRKKVDKKGV